MDLHGIARLRWLAVAALLGVVSCTPGTKFDSALLVKVTVPPGSASKCVRVLVKADSGEFAATGPLAAKPELSIAVYRAKGWSAGVRIEARGYANCDGATDTDAFVEKSGSQSVSFPATGTDTVTLALVVKPADADNDGHPAGTEDCNDNDALVYAGAPEQCTSTVDRNCNGLTGCSDLTCSGACGNNGAGTCQSGQCTGVTEVSCTDGQDNDGDQLIDCADSDCSNIACSDSNACTTGETCSSGVCGGGTNVACNTPPGACFAATGTCNPVDGNCSYAVRTGTCDDQSACTSADTCLTDGGCEGTPSVVCNAPPSQCYQAAGACIPQDGGCSYTVRTGSCDDSNACTSGESCQSNGSCGAPSSTTSCSTPPGQCFVSAGVCNTADGGCSYAVRTGTCDDGNACTTGEQCLTDGGCGTGSPVVCTQTADQCRQTTGACNPLDGMCSYALKTGACNDSNACTSGETCNAAGACTGGVGTVTCNSPPGQCYDVAGACIPADAGCAYTVRTGTCDDNNACTTGESCQTNGTCGAPTSNVTCASPPNACFTTAGTCVPANGSCTYSLKPGNNNTCDDNNACTVGDRCLADGGCANPTSTVSCTTPPGQCFAATGTCNPSDASCSYAVRTGACEDGDPCTTGEQCLLDGGCGTGTAVVCNSPPGQCFNTTGTCQVSDGGCAYTVRTGSCNDSNACTSGETCQSDGSCGAPTTTKTCAAPAQCFDAGFCQPQDAGCFYPPAPSGDGCNDGNLCNTGDTCNGAGVCTAGSTVVTCSAANSCFDAGTCSPSTGCPTPAPMPGIACSDTDPCTLGETCSSAGLCTAGSTTTCTPNECQNGGTCLGDAGCSFGFKNGKCNANAGDCRSGVCITPVAFPYTPSNFTANTSKVTSELTIDCALTFNTDGTNPTFTSCDPNEQVTSEVITQTATTADGGTAGAVVLHVAKLNVTSTGSLTVTGGRPLIIAVYGDATMAGTIEVSATQQTSGPGAGLSCPTSSPTNGTRVIGQGGGGAGGGGNASTGGNGAQGGGATGGFGLGGAVTGTNAALAPLVGGCKGAIGGNTTGSGGLGGGGGGAVQISAAGTLVVSGRIAAAGGGGGAGFNVGLNLPGTGGGGGGAAGGILLEGNALTIRAAARITANGGSGGEGGSSTQGDISANGTDGLKDTRNAATTPNDSSGGAGGNGGAGNALNGSTPANAGGTNGGGGGGGAVGRVRMNSATSLCRENNHVVSPSNNNATNGGFSISAGTQTTGATCP